MPDAAPTEGELAPSTGIRAACEWPEAPVRQAPHPRSVDNDTFSLAMSPAPQVLDAPPTAASTAPPPSLTHSIIGLGRFGTIHARRLARLPGFQLRAVVDPRTTLPKELGTLPLLRHVDELPRDIASATVATSDAAHAEVAIALMARGCHVLVEKPLCLAPEEGERMLRMARQYGTTLCVGHVERFNPVFGDSLPASLRLAARSARNHAEPFLRFRRRSCRQAAPADSILDLMVHDLDLMAWLCAIPPDAPMELMDRDLGTHAVRALIRLDGLVAELESGYDSALPTACMDVRTTGHGVQHFDLRSPQVCQPAANDALSRQYAAFHRAIRGMSSRIATGHDGLAAVVRAHQILVA